MIAHFVSADWGMTPGKRAVWIADVSNGGIRMAGRPSGYWNLDKLLGLAEELAEDGPVLVGTDVVLGVSEGYWKPVQKTSEIAHGNPVDAAHNIFVNGFRPCDTPVRRNDKSPTMRYKLV